MGVALIKAEIAESVFVKVQAVWGLQVFFIEFTSLNGVISWNYLICKDTRQ